MADPDYRVVFEGQIADGFSIGMVKKNLAKLFKADAERIATIFSGQAVVLKRDIDHATALKYQAALQKAGALTSLKSSAGRNSGTATATATATTTTTTTAPAQTAAAEATQGNGSPAVWSIAPAGTELLRADERRQYEEAKMDLSHISIASSFMNFDDDAQSHPEAAAPDTSHITVAEVGETLSDNSQKQPPLAVNDLQASIAPVGADLSERQQEHEPLELDLSHISLAN